jgi:hypothetical protein
VVEGGRHRGQRPGRRGPLARQINHSGNSTHVLRPRSFRSATADSATVSVRIRCQSGKLNRASPGSLVLTSPPSYLNLPNFQACSDKLSPNSLISVRGVTLCRAFHARALRAIRPARFRQTQTPAQAGEFAKGVKWLRIAYCGAIGNRGPLNTRPELQELRD